MMRRREEEDGEEEGAAAEETESSSRRFFGCYLLVSISPRHKGQTYIGFTVNPKRRIRQHNGELRSGAWRTKNKRPWEMVLCIYGFPTNVSALQFEWAWQHPRVSLAVREAAANFKTLSGVANKVKLAYTMLTLPSWQSLNITVNYFSTKYSKHSAGCVSLPEHMKIRVCPMDELPCYVDGSVNSIESENEWEDCGEAGSASGSQEESSMNAAVQRTFPDNEPLESRKANDREQSVETRTFGAQGAAQSSPVISPVRALSPVMPSLSCSGDTPIGKNLFTSIEELSVDSEQPAHNQSRALSPVKDRGSTSSGPVASQEIEIIELVTPPPDPRSRELHAKRRRVSTMHPQIIDLTNSPVVIQL